MSEKNEQQQLFEFEQRPVIKGFPELRWTGKKPYTSTQYYPAQLKEKYGEENDGWINKIFWGDNLQVMSHMLKEYREKIDLIYIDPPFDSKADYKKKIEIRGIGKAENDSNSFEEKQYGDIWSNDEYLQFMYERLVLLRELLSESGSIYLHCDWHKSHHLRMLLDEVFGQDNFVNEIAWCYKSGGAGSGCYAKKHDTLLFYRKSSKMLFNIVKEKSYMFPWSGENPAQTYYQDEKGRYTLVNVKDYWTDIGMIATSSFERQGYPTQKPEALLERIIQVSSNPGDIIFDCFMGSGTTQAVAMKLGRKFIGADINLGAVQTTTKRLLSIAEELNSKIDLDDTKYTGFEVYNVNNYDFFRNPIEAKELLIQALEIQPFDKGNIWDGELDGRMVKIMPVNRIATKADLEELKSRLPYQTYEKRRSDNPNQPAEKITIVCMGHDADLKASLEKDLEKYKIDIQIVDILKDKSELQFKREAEAEIVKEGNKLVIRNFYPMNLMQKLSLQKEKVDEWRQLVESIMIDWNYDGAVLNPSITDIPEKNSLVNGVYDIPENAGTIRVKITDLLSESLEIEV